MISLFPIEGEIFPTQGEIFALENISQRHPGPKCESEPSGKGWGGVGGWEKLSRSFGRASLPHSWGQPLHEPGRAVPLIYLFTDFLHVI